MQTIRGCESMVRRTVGTVLFFFSTTASAQEAVPEVAASAGLIFGLNLVQMVGIGVLLLLFLVLTVLLLVYRSRFLRFAAKCEVMEPELAKTRSELYEVTDWSDLHERMIANTGAAVFRLNTEGKCVYANPAMETLSGFSKHRILKTGLLDAVHPEDREKVREEWQAFAARQQPHKSFYRLKRQGGGIVHVLGWGSTLRNKEADVIGYSGMLMDVSEWVHEREQARMAEQRCNSFVQQGVGGFYELRPDEPIALSLPADEVANLIYQRSKLAACSSEMAALYGLSTDELTGSYLKDLPGGCGLFESPERVRQFVSDEFKSIGIEMVRVDYRGTHVWLRNDVVGMVEDGRLVSIWGTQHDISRQKREMEEMEHRTEFSDRILNALPGEVFVKDPRCRFLYVNQGVEERTGIPVDDWVEKTVFEVFPATPRDFNKMSIESMKTGKLCRTTASRPGENGEVWIETFERPLVSEDGVVEGVVGISVDVTERTRREQALQESEARFHHLVENSPAGIIMAEAASKTITYANPAFCDLFGYTAEEVRDLGISDLHSPGSRKQVLSRWDERARNGQCFEEALPCLRKDRSVVFADVGVLSGRLDGTELVVGVYSDASGRKEIENRLEWQRDVQAGLLHDASVLVAEMDSAGVIRSANDTLLERLGYDESELVGRPYVDTLVCEADRESLKNIFANAVPGGQPDHTYRLVAAEGALYTVVSRIRTQLNPSGETEGFAVSGVDITQQKALEEQLRSECDGLRDRLAEREERVVATLEAKSESEQLREMLEKKLKKLEKTLGDRVQQFEQNMVEHEQRETELTETIGSLENRRTEMEEALEVRREELAKESGQRRELDEQLQKIRQEFAAEREAFKTESGTRMEHLEQDVKRLCAREEELVAESAALHSKLSETEEAFCTRTQELESRSSEWEACQSDLLEIRRALEARAEQQERDLKQAVEVRTQMEEELRTCRKAAVSGQKTMRVQIEQQTGLLKKELKGVKKQAEKLKNTHDKTVRQLTGLEKVHGDRTRELEAQTAARKKEEQEFQKTKRRLEDAVVQEKNKFLERIEQFDEGKAKGRKTEKVLRCKAAENVKLELLIDQRTRKLSQVSSQRVALEDRLAESREETIRERESVAEQIEQQTQSLKHKLEGREEREEQLKKEQGELTRRLAGLEKTLGERTGQVEALLKTKEELEGLIENEKENLAKRIQLFKDEMSERRTTEEGWEQREDALMEKIEGVEQSLQQRTRELTHEAGERKRMEQEAACLKKATEVDHRLTYDLSEDLCEPIGSILNLSKAIQEEDRLPEGAHTQLIEINRCGRRLKSILNYRLEITHLEDGVIHVQPESFDLNTFLAGLTGEFREKAEARQIFFGFSHAGDFSGSVCADQTKVRRILYTLLNHALEHSSGRQMGLHTICEELEEGRKKIVFLLMYSGLGKDLAVTGGLFDPSGRNKSFSDMGKEEFRLDLARRYAQLLGGGLYLKNRSEQKQMLSFVLPVEYEPASDMAV